MTDREALGAALGSIAQLSGCGDPTEMIATTEVPTRRAKE